MGRHVPHRVLRRSKKGGGGACSLLSRDLAASLHKSLSGAPTRNAHTVTTFELLGSVKRDAGKLFFQINRPIAPAASANN